MNWFMVFWIFFFSEIVIAGVAMLIIMSWNIPVTILRYTGNKGRPLMIHKKARKTFKNGVPRLFVRGYSEPIRDYLSENYYPTMRGKYGGLILWEFEDGLLTPALPKRTFFQKILGKDKLSKEDEEFYERAKEFYKSRSVPFDFDRQLYADLKLKAVDDVDVEFGLQEIFRVDNQYSGGWKDFFLKYGGHMAIIIIAVLMLIGVIKWFDKIPEFAAMCAATAKGIVEESLIRQAANAAVPLG